MIKFKNGFAVESGEVEAHHFSLDNGDYLGTWTTHVSEGCGLSAGATLASLPIIPAGHSLRRVGQRWTVLKDYRGTVYQTDSGLALQHNELGELPPGLTDLPRPSQHHQWSGDHWGISPQLLYASKTQEINEACKTAITGGFWSAALGQRYQYSSQMDDQLNLTGLILLGSDSVYGCRDEQGVKELIAHTAKQLGQVNDDFTRFKLGLLQRANSIKQLLDKALAQGDLNALEAVTWESVQ